MCSHASPAVCCALVEGAGVLARPELVFQAFGDAPAAPGQALDADELKLLQVRPLLLQSRTLHAVAASTCVYHHSLLAIPVVAMKKSEKSLM